MAYRDFKDLPEDQLLVKYYVVKHLKQLKIQNMMNINVNLLQWFINFLIKNGAIQNQQLAEELHKLITRNLKTKKSVILF